MDPICLKQKAKKHHLRVPMNRENLLFQFGMEITNPHFLVVCKATAVAELPGSFVYLLAMGGMSTSAAGPGRWGPGEQVPPDRPTGKPSSGGYLPGPKAGLKS